MKKSEIVSNLLKAKGIKISYAAQYLEYKSETGMWHGVNNDTLNSARLIRLAELLEVDALSLMRFISTPKSTEIVVYSGSIESKNSSISEAKNPHELAGLLFQFKDDLDGLVSKYRLAHNDGK